MKKLLRLRTMLLLCALIAGGSSVWAEEETISEGTFTSSSITSGWTSTGTGGNSSYVVIGKDESITSPALNLSQYTSITVSVSARRYGSLSGSKATVAIFVGETQQGDAYDYTNNKSLASHDFAFTPTSSMTASAIVVTCTNATSAGNTHGAGIGSITIKGTKPDGTATTTTIVSTGITNTYINKGTSAGKLSFTVTETKGGAAVDGATVTWDSSDKSVATIADDGTVTLVGVGSTDLTATYTGDATYVGSSDKYTLTVTDSRADAGLVVEDDFEMEVTTTIAIADLYLTESDGEVTVTSASPAVVKVEDGLLKALSVGSAVITVSVAATDDYAAASDQITVTVTAKEAVEPVGPTNTEGKFVKVTSDEDLTDGDYLIVNEEAKVAFDGSLEKLDAVSDVIEVTINNGVITETDAAKAAMFTIDVTAGTLKAANGQYVGVTAYSNGLAQSATSDYTNSFSIDEDGNAVITVSTSGGTMTLRFNSASNQNRFRYYKSGQQAIQLYKYVAGTQESTFDVTVGDAKWRTLVSSKNVTLPEGLAAYIVTASSASSATLTAVSKVKANTAVLLNGNAGDYTLTVTEDDVTYDDTNLLQVSTESTGNGVYVLADKDGVGFYKWTGGSLGAGRVYLPAPAAAAREFLSFDFGETTGINNVESSKLDVEGFYNLAGQRVAQPTKGLYIVNGKKVIIK